MNPVNRLIKERGLYEAIKHLHTGPVELSLPPNMYAATEAEWDRVCNGCGAKGSFIKIPQSFFGLNMEPKKPPLGE